MTRPQSEQTRDCRWIVGVYAALLVLVVPWYWPSGDATLVFGIPVWALVTLGAVFLTSAFTAWVYLAHSDDPND